ncbi:hypothetical protein H6F88_29830 [Oculatella sp. FACHB-28]|nr:hypothetical protein [Oculatella sp. FACHB-28]MBD2066830.1 hypothetical protein [Leptolyngbya sp. FACHB-671]
MRQPVGWKTAQAIRNSTKALLTNGDRPHPPVSRPLQASPKTYLNFQVKIRFCNMASNILKAQH